MVFENWFLASDSSQPYAGRFYESDGKEQSFNLDTSRCSV
jgi:hypothetical protein